LASDGGGDAGCCGSPQTGAFDALRLTAFLLFVPFTTFHSMHSKQKYFQKSTGLV
jgi:hypothetical protein